MKKSSKSSRTRAAKMKGAKGQKDVKYKLLERFPELEEDDIICAESSSNGEDLKLSPRARELFPFNIEVKSQKNLTMDTWYKQAAAHGKHEPIVICKKNYGKWYATVSLDFFLQIFPPWGQR